MLSLTTISILAWSKIIGFGFIFLGLYFIWRRKSVKHWLYLTALAILLFYWLLAKDLQTMFWGNLGDEMFILAYLSKTLAGHLGRDFYYDWLPQFYPPLYFWLTGILAKPIASNAITAAKLGVLGTFSLWFLGAFYYQKLWWQKNYQRKIEFFQITQIPWFWYLFPVLYFLALDFDAVIFKPYEAISALFAVLVLTFFARAIFQNHWPKKYYLFFTLSLSVLFLTYYFWFVILIPTAFILVLLSKKIKLNLRRLINLALLVLPFALIFVGPLLWSYYHYGVDNTQATHFVSGDFFSFLPWQIFSVRGFLSLLGLLAMLIFYKKSAIKTTSWILGLCFVYQLINFFLFVSGLKPIQASKPFYFLGTAALMYAATYILVYFYQKFFKKIKKQHLLAILSIIFILLSGLLPNFSFVDKPEILQQIEKDLREPNIVVLSQDIKNIVPDYQSRTWLSTGALELNAYLPISYYLANAVHFSHHSALFSKRLQEFKNLSQSKSTQEFMQIIDQGEPRKIDSLLFYDDQKDKDNYIFYIWVDNYPNGGKNQTITLPKKLISEEDWQKVYDKNNWLIFLRK